MNKKKARYIIIPFLSIVFGFFILNIITPEKNIVLLKIEILIKNQH